MSAPDELSYGDVLHRIAELAEQLTECSDPVIATQVTELLDWVDAFHRDGLGRLIEMIRAWRGEIFLDSVAADEVAGTLLAAYGFGDGPALGVGPEDAVTAALDEVAPVVASHGGSIDVVEITDGVVRVRMEGTCDGCPSASATLKHGLEAALREHWPSFRRLEVLDLPAAVDQAKSDLRCVASASPKPERLLQIRGHEEP